MVGRASLLGLRPSLNYQKRPTFQPWSRTTSWFIRLSSLAMTLNFEKGFSNWKILPYRTSYEVAERTIESCGEHKINRVNQPAPPQESTDSDRLCLNCGTTHNIGQCLADTKSCFRCKKTGHFHKSRSRQSLCPFDQNGSRSDGRNRCDFRPRSSSRRLEQSRGRNTSNGRRSRDQSRGRDFRRNRDKSRGRDASQDLCVSIRIISSLMPTTLVSISPSLKLFTLDSVDSHV